jgi:ArsR family transcriptional regulator
MSSENNLQTPPVVPQLAAFFRALSQSIRLEILLSIGSGEACVCHLEAVLGQRQAYISQHLMALRDAEIIASRRDGRFVYYSLVKPELLALLQSAAEMSGFGEANLLAPPAQPQVACPCPRCTPEAEAIILTEDVTEPQKR